MPFNFIPHLRFSMGGRKFEIKEVWHSKDKTTVVFFELGKPEKEIERTESYLNTLELDYLGINWGRQKGKLLISF